MNKAKMIARIVLGLIFFVFGLNGFFNFMPMPKEIPEAAMSFSMAMMQTKYFFPFIKVTEVICGALLLSGFYVPLALIVLAPITLNILMFHAFLAPSGMGMAILVVALNAFLGWCYRDRYKSILKAK